MGSSDEEKEGKEEKGTKMGKEEEDEDEMTKIDARIEELQKLEAAEARRCITCMQYNRIKCMGMDHKKVPILCLLKRRFLAVQRKWNVWNTARSAPRLIKRSVQW